jgi:hypothetical protein
MTQRLWSSGVSHAQLRMLQGIAVTTVAEAWRAGFSQARVGRFGLTARRWESRFTTDGVTMELVVSCDGEVIEYGVGPPRGIG